MIYTIKLKTKTLKGEFDDIKTMLFMSMSFYLAALTASIFLIPVFSFHAVQRHTSLFREPLPDLPLGH